MGCRCRHIAAATMTTSGRGAAWLACLTGGQEVAGSNPVAPSGLHRDRPKGRSRCFDGCLATPPASDYPLGSEIQPPVSGSRQVFCSAPSLVTYAVRGRRARKNPQKRIRHRVICRRGTEIARDSGRKANLPSSTGHLPAISARAADLPRWVGFHAKRNLLEPKPLCGV